MQSNSVIDYLEENFVIIPESVLKRSAKALEEIGEPENNFRNMLNIAEEYKKAELTPVIAYNFDTGMMICIVKELYGKKLH